MRLRQLAKSQWQSFFDGLEPLLRAHVVEVEASGLDLKGKITADWVRLAELSYDPGSDTMQIAVHGGERPIAHPTQVLLREDEDGWLHSIEIVDRGGDRDFVILKEPLAAPPG